MPTVHVRATLADAAAATDALTAIARAVAADVPCDLGGVWCTWTPLGAQTVGDEPRAGAGAIVYVDVWIRPREDDGAITRALEAACQAAADGFGVPVEDVWGTLRPVEPGRVFAGGALIRD